MRDTIPMKTKRNDDYVITMDGYSKENYKWDPVQKKVVYIKKGAGTTSKKKDIYKELEIEKSKDRRVNTKNLLNFVQDQIEGTFGLKTVYRDGYITCFDKGEMVARFEPNTLSEELWNGFSDGEIPTTYRAIKEIGRINK